MLLNRIYLIICLSFVNLHLLLAQTDKIIIEDTNLESDWIHDDIMRTDGIKIASNGYNMRNRDGPRYDMHRNNEDIIEGNNKYSEIYVKKAKASEKEKS